MQRKLPACLRKQGFTLIELLIVIAIIGGLAAIGLITYPGTQRTARDTERKSDIKQYQTLLEIFANRSNGLYPHFSPSASTGSDVCGGSPTLYTVLGLTGACVNDSIATAPYRYFAIGGSGAAGSPSATGYLIYATLERPATDGGVQYWVICSNGTAGRVAASAWTPSSTCPSNLQP